MTYSLDFAPHIPSFVLWVLIAAAAILFIYSLVLRARGAWLRVFALAIAIFALADPIVVHENRESLPDIVALIVDRSPSMDIHGRRAQADKAEAAIRAKLAADKSLEVRTAEITAPPGEDTGTQLFAALSSALADAPPDRVAGAIAITDGQIHDVPVGKPSLHAPLQALIVGQRNEGDRKLTVVGAARYVIVGQTANITLRVDDFGSPPGSRAKVEVHVDGVDAGTRTIATGVDTHIGIAVNHAGENVVELNAQPGPAELGLQNNRAVVAINGVRDRLRVLLISGEPNAGERVWRSLLKSDPSVDLVHFTILRPPEKQDSTPIDQLSLIIFPTRDLFVEKLSSFDLIIFDRFRVQPAVLPLAYFDNITRYVENGGALLVSSGPEYAGLQSISRTPLSAVLPAQATGDVVDQPFKPLVTAQGLAHPVTRDLEGANNGDKPPTWGLWFRTIATSRVSGETLMSGPDSRPLLVLDRVGKGRVAELLSDQGWLWARGYQGGGALCRVAAAHGALGDEGAGAGRRAPHRHDLRRRDRDGAPHHGGQRQAGDDDRSVGQANHHAALEGRARRVARGGEGRCARSLSRDGRDAQRRRSVGPAEPERSLRHARDGCGVESAHRSHRRQRALARRRTARHPPRRRRRHGLRRRLDRPARQSRLSRHQRGAATAAARMARADPDPGIAAARVAPRGALTGPIKRPCPRSASNAINRRRHATAGRFPSRRPRRSSHSRGHGRG